MLAPYAEADDERHADDRPTNSTDGPVLDARGWQVMTHAAGDRAVNMALTAYEHAVRSNPPPERGRRHRIEHLETVDATDIPRFGALGVIASMQPYHGSPSRVDVWLENVGAERASRGWPYGRIAAGAGRLAFGSDWPSSLSIRCSACTP
jgi:predicted amidohydrolase YtcJ